MWEKVHPHTVRYVQVLSTEILCSFISVLWLIKYILIKMFVTWHVSALNVVNVRTVQLQSSQKVYIMCMF